jgi:hypothetical protein
MGFETKLNKFERKAVRFVIFLFTLSGLAFAVYYGIVKPILEALV